MPAVLPVWEVYGNILRRNGYGVATGILRTEEFGVLQTRRRAILIARLCEEQVSLPSPTHQAYRRGAAEQGALELKPWVSMSEALNHGARFTVISNYGSGGDPRNRGQRRSDEPSATITGKVRRNRLRLTDGDEDRFTDQEAGRLQTFPLDYPWWSALDIELDLNELDRTVDSSWMDGRPMPLGTRLADQVSVALD